MDAPVRRAKGSRTCSQQGCEIPARVKGFCGRHYARYLRGADMDALPKWGEGSVERTCSHPGCGRKHSAKGFCKSHYSKFLSPEEKERRYARSRKPKQKVTCSSCGEIFARSRVFKNNYCSMKCYNDAGNTRRKEKALDHTSPRCVVPNCNRASRSKGMCDCHSSRVRLGVPLDKPIQLKGTYGEWLNPGGYVVKNTPHGQILKHRWVMKQHVGRSLLKIETVHHINGEKSDNRLENLELWSSSHPPGQRVADKLQWAREILATYKGQLHLFE